MGTINLQHPLRIGAIIGLLLMPPLMILMVLGAQFAGLPFLPFDLFNWVARVLPGALITFGIDAMVDTLILFGLGENLDSAAKTAEQIIAIITFIIGGAVLGILAFLAFRRFRLSAENALLGAEVGLVLGSPFILISMNVNVSSAAPLWVQIAWHGLLFSGVGMLLSWAYNEMTFSAQKALATSSAQSLGRREFIIKVGGASAVLTVAGAGLSSILKMDENIQSDSIASISTSPRSSNDPLPNASSSVDPVPGTRPEVTPLSNHYRIDILSGGLPSIPASYTLPITGLVANEVRWTLDDLRAMPAMEEYITMSCISNRIGGSLIGTTKWTGVSFQHILEQIQPDENAVALKITGADNFDEYISLDLIRQDERVMLAYAWDDQPLPLRNGYPLRTHIPDRYGMKQPKWIEKIEVVHEHEAGYWVRRGWSREAIVNATSVVDTVATNAIYRNDAGEMVIPIGGIAWAGDRTIAAVEISVDGGEWMLAQLREPLSNRAWTIWRFDWPFVEGHHTFEVRAYEEALEGQSDLILQETSKRGTRPDGATGIHSERAFLMMPETES